VSGTVSVLFVCTGNICRSPTAEGVLQQLVLNSGLQGKVRTDSAGTHEYHAGEPPDRRAIAHANARGYDISGLRARQVTAQDFEDFDLVLAMDRGHLRFMEQLCAPEHRAKLGLYLDFAGVKDADVPDPYGGGPAEYERAAARIHRAIEERLDDF